MDNTYYTDDDPGHLSCGCCACCGCSCASCDVCGPHHDGDDHAESDYHREKTEAQAASAAAWAAKHEPATVRAVEALVAALTFS